MQGIEIMEFLNGDRALVIGAGSEHAALIGPEFIRANAVDGTLYVLASDSALLELEGIWSFRGLEAGTVSDFQIFAQANGDLVVKVLGAVDVVFTAPADRGTSGPVRSDPGPARPSALSALPAAPVARIMGSSAASSDASGADDGLSVFTMLRFNFSAARATAAVIAPQALLSGASGSIHFWFMPEVVSGTMTLLSRHANPENGLVVSLVEGRVVLRQSVDGESAEIVTDITLPPQLWVYLVLVWNEDGLQLWVDGVMVGSLAGGTEIARTCLATVLGADHAVREDRADGAAEFFNHFSGNIEDVRIFDYALDADTLRALIAGESGLPDVSVGNCGFDLTDAEEWVDMTPIAAE